MPDRKPTVCFRTALSLAGAGSPMQGHRLACLSGHGHQFAAGPDRNGVGGLVSRGGGKRPPRARRRVVVRQGGPAPVSENASTSIPVGVTPFDPAFPAHSDHRITRSLVATRLDQVRMVPANQKRDTSHPPRFHPHPKSPNPSPPRSPRPPRRAAPPVRSRPARPARPTRPACPACPARPTRPACPACPARPTRPARPAQPPRPTPPARPARPAPPPPTRPTLPGLGTSFPGLRALLPTYAPMNYPKPGNFLP